MSRRRHAQPSADFAPDLLLYRSMIDPRLPWIGKVRLKVLAIVVAAVLAGIAVVSWLTMPVWPIVGVAVAAFAMAVNTIGTRLSHATCYECGKDLKGQPENELGVLCPSCGLINPGASPTATDTRLAHRHDDADADPTEAPDEDAKPAA